MTAVAIFDSTWLDVTPCVAFQAVVAQARAQQEAGATEAASAPAQGAGPVNGDFVRAVASLNRVFGVVGEDATRAELVAFLHEQGYADVADGAAADSFPFVNTLNRVPADLLAVLREHMEVIARR